MLCPEGLNGEMEASQFPFKELSLWDTATPGKPTCEPQLIEVNLSGMQSQSVTTTIQTPQTTPILPIPPAYIAEPSSDIAAAINLQLMGALVCLQQVSPITSACLPAQHIQETATICSSGGSVSSRRIRRTSQARGVGLMTLVPMATLT